MKDLYATLGVRPDASPDEIRQAFRRAAVAGHPDRGGDPERFKDVSAAYSVLSDQDLRSKYDAARAAPPGTSAAADAMRAFLAKWALQLWGDIGAELPELPRLHDAYKRRDWLGVGESLFGLLRRARS